MTKVYFVGGYAKGQVKDMAEPLSSVYHVVEDVPPGNVPTTAIEGSKRPTMSAVTHLYILHTVMRDGKPYRCYISNEKELGGLIESDFAHLPG